MRRAAKRSWEHLSARRKGEFETGVSRKATLKCGAEGLGESLPLDGKERRERAARENLILRPKEKEHGDNIYCERGHNNRVRCRGVLRGGKVKTPS